MYILTVLAIIAYLAGSYALMEWDLSKKIKLPPALVWCMLPALIVIMMFWICADMLFSPDSKKPACE